MLRSGTDSDTYRIHVARAMHARTRLGCFLGEGRLNSFCLPFMLEYERVVSAHPRRTGRCGRVPHAGEPIQDTLGSGDPL